MTRTLELAELIKTLNTGSSSTPLRLPLALENQAGTNSTGSPLAELTTLLSTSGVSSTASDLRTAPSDSSSAFDQLLSHLVQVSNSNKEHADTVKANTQALIANSTTRGTAQTVSDTARGAASVVTSGLGLSPLISGLIHLFTGSNKQEPPPPLIKYQLPASIRADAGLNQSNDIFTIDRNATGEARVSATREAPQITLQINALDSKSIMDRSDDIASAVRNAMLHSNSLNDVIQDL